MRADTPIPVLWAYMLVTGVGSRPHVRGVHPHRPEQRAHRRLGAASSSLTFFQQVGGTVGLAITGTIFASALAEQVPTPGRAADVPPQLAEMMAGGGLGANRLTAVGDLGTAILGGVPEAPGPRSSPSSPTLVNAIYEAFSLATASTFTVGIVGSLIAAGLVLLLREAPARATEHAPASASAVAPDGGGQEAGGSTRSWAATRSWCRWRSRTTSCQAAAASRSGTRWGP